MTKKEKLEKLEQVAKQLKSEFVGLDSIIDEIITSLVPWYVTPEILDRPVVISLWGMTGTGKTSVINRLIDLLDLSHKKIAIDCGTISSSSFSNSFTEMLDNYLNIDNSETIYSDFKALTQDLVFVLDEFQHNRTISNRGEENDKSKTQSIWSLLDSGRISVEPDRNYSTSRVFDFCSDLRKFITSCHAEDIQINDRMIEKEEDVKLVLDNLGYFWYDRGNSETRRRRYLTFPPVNKEEEEENQYKPLYVFPDDITRGFIKNYIKKVPVNPGDIFEELGKLKTLGELSQYMDDKLKILTNTEELDCTKSLVFIIGNLDEAYKVSDEITPDLDADIFYEETSKISINDIKKALMSKFRPEQIGRFGNNIIKYPVLSSDSFKKIIKKEVDRIIGVFKETSGIEIKVSEDFLGLLYSEGVYPVQGVRPVYTTIGSIFTPLLSKILIGEGKDCYIDVKNPDEGFNVPSKTICIISGDGVQDVTIPLNLGSLRYPGNCKNRYKKSVHEIGHAIAHSYFTGIIPSTIVSVASDRGGFCVTYDPDKNTEIQCKSDIENSVRVGIAGYLAEQVIYGRDNVLMGSGSDLDTSWVTLSNAVYNLGFSEPIKLSEPGIYHSETSGIPVGLGKSEEAFIETTYSKIVSEVTSLLRREEELLKNAALLLGDKGKISGKEFSELIKKYGKVLTLSHVANIKGKRSNTEDEQRGFLL